MHDEKVILEICELDFPDWNMSHQWFLWWMIKREFRRANGASRSHSLEHSTRRWASISNGNNTEQVWSPPFWIYIRERYYTRDVEQVKRSSYNGCGLNGSNYICGRELGGWFNEVWGWKSVEMVCESLNQTKNPCRVLWRTKGPKVIIVEFLYRKIIEMFRYCTLSDKVFKFLHKLSSGDLYISD